MPAIEGRECRHAYETGRYMGALEGSHVGMCPYHSTERTLKACWIEGFHTGRTAMRRQDPADAWRIASALMQKAFDGL